MYGALNDPYFVILVLSCAAIVTIGAIVTALGRMPQQKLLDCRTSSKSSQGE